MVRFKYIYSISDPDDTLCFYIGATNNPEQRFLCHLNMNMSAPCQYRIKSILDLGKKPVFEILELCTENWRDKEQELIALAISKGANLINKQIRGHIKSLNKFVNINIITP